MKRLKILREQYIALSKEVEDVMGRLSWPERQTEISLINDT
jgi:hypothetical protein